MRAVALIAIHSPDVIMVPSGWWTACSIGGLDIFPCDILTSGSSLQSSKFQRISEGYSDGLVAGWCADRLAECEVKCETESLGAIVETELLRTASCKLLGCKLNQQHFGYKDILTCWQGFNL
jgi:hypothetical protein